MFNTILVLAPHTDDGELGCGATIARYINEGKNVYYAAFSICEESVPEGFPKNILETEVKKATSVLGIKKENLIIYKFKVRRFPEFRQEILEELVKLNRKIKPDLVFMPSSFDIHQDHKTIFEEGRRAFKNSSILGYEFMWNNFSFNSACTIVVNEDHIDKKMESINKYESQAKRFYASDKMVTGLANYRGLQISNEFAEAFEVIRWIIP
ncbi:MAG: PIG-L family deacetylase [Bacteroidales bacterium]|nr:PIG-L family deacetylase [Bacteroidales bacterium]